MAAPAAAAGGLGGRRKSAFQPADSSSKAFKIRGKSPHRKLNGAPDDPASHLQSLESQDPYSDSPMIDPNLHRDGHGGDTDLHNNSNNNNDGHHNSSNKRPRRDSSSSSSSSSSSQSTVADVRDTSSTHARTAAAETTAAAPASTVDTTATKKRKVPLGNDVRTPANASSQV